MLIPESQKDLVLIVVGPCCHLQCRRWRFLDALDGVSVIINGLISGAAMVFLLAAN